jgi:hypothetical protein
MVLLAGCTRGREPHPRPRARTTAAAASEAPAPPEVLDAALPSEQPRVLPGPLSACILRVREQSPRELLGALDALEYGSVAEDACRLDLALATRDATLCEPIALSALRERCLARTAIALARPDECPPSVSDRGRDPTCVALAARLPGLCSAASRHEQVRCLAIARGDARLCEPLDPLLRPRCHADVLALREALPRLRGPSLPPATAQLRILPAVPDADAGEDAPPSRPLPALARGAFLDPQGTVYLVDPTRGWPSRSAHSLGSAQPIVGVAFSLPARPGRTVLTELRVVLPDGTVIEPRSPEPQPVVELTEMARTPGGVVAGRLRARAFALGSPVTVELEFRTFLRDLLPAEQLREDVAR